MLNLMYLITTVPLKWSNVKSVEGIRLIRLATFNICLISQMLRASDSLD